MPATPAIVASSAWRQRWRRQKASPGEAEGVADAGEVEEVEEVEEALTGGMGVTCHQIIYNFN
ncbi:hypothetical protein U875_01260 [Pandoraea pnomenusa 3kgm]|nr:hypothetical protein U875_01260 [Pandoraea pnomenusa 3kgm]AMQ96098.1 hypothetical protein DA70_24780 [Pandoraea pnomenusa]